MRRMLAGMLILLAAVMVATQLLLPRLIEGRVEHRLEQGGGSADVSIGALPALTLLASRGDSFEATGSGLRFDLDDRREEPFRRLDGFTRVEMSLREIEVGPLRIERLRLARTGRSEPYDLTVAGTTSPRELAETLGGAAGGTLGGLLGSLAGGVLPGVGGAEIPVMLDARVESTDGKPEVTAADATVAGFPAGPLAEIVLATVLDRL